MSHSITSSIYYFMKSNWHHSVLYAIIPRIVELIAKCQLPKLSRSTIRLEIESIVTLSSSVDRWNGWLYRFSGVFFKPGC